MSGPWRLQQRIQRYGWDLAASDYEPLWVRQLGAVQALLLGVAGLRPGQQVLDVACGTGLVSFPAAQAVGADGEVIGVDLSGAMTDTCTRRGAEAGIGNARFERMDAQALAFADGRFDAVLCALGMMYVPRPEVALAEIARVLRPGGEATFSVWGERARCGWASVFPIVDEEVRSEVCPMFFQFGIPDALALDCAEAGLEVLQQERIAVSLEYADAEEACEAVFVGGPVALAWSRFDAPTRVRVRERYLESIARWRHGEGFRIPGEFVVVKARRVADAD